MQIITALGQICLGQTPNSTSDTTINLGESTIVSDTIKNKDTVSVAKSDIETTIVYSAEDSIRMDVINKVVYLYGNAKIDYGNISLEAAKIEIDWSTNVLSAFPALDSSGKKIGVPVFKEGADVYVVDTIRYNAKTKKGLIKGVVTKQGEGILHGEKVKKVEDNLYISSAKYTTCDLAHPHFYIHARKLKVIPKDKIVSGPFNLVIADVPTPAGFFLGSFPIPNRKKSGLIIPTFGSTAQRGFCLRQGGYYWAMNQYVGIQAIGDVYANGSYRGSLNASYRKRYGFQGNLSFNYSEVRNTFEESETPFQDVSFLWDHSTISRKNSSLNARVNILSNGFYKRNSYNPTTFQTGAFSSTVMYTKTFGNSPFNLNVGLRQDQNIQTGVMNATLPDITLNMNRIYPFKNSAIARKGITNSILNNFYVQYTGQAQYNITNDTLRTAIETVGRDTLLPFNLTNLPELLKRAQYGARHTVPIGTTIKFNKTFLKYFNFSPIATFEDWMYPYRYEYKLNTATNELVAERVGGFTNAYAYNLSMVVNTTIYGMYKFKSKKLLGIRHTLNPIISYQYRPDFTRANYQIDVLVDTTGQRSNFSRYPTFPYGGPGSLTASILNFSFNNTIEAKATSKKDTVTGIKKFKLIDQFILAGYYNFEDTSFYKLSNITMQGRTRIGNRFDVYGSALFDPYAYETVNGTSRRTANYAIAAGNGLARMLSYNLSIAANLSPDPKRKKYQSPNANPNDLALINANPDLYVDFNIPWTLNLSYNINWTKSFTRLPNNLTQSLTFMGDVRLTEKWKIVFNSGYDFVAKNITTTRVDIYGDLHCWQMSLNIVPFGIIRSFGFTISAKSSILQDLKLNKRSTTYYGTYLY